MLQDNPGWSPSNVSLTAAIQSIKVARRAGQTDHWSGHMDEIDGRRVLFVMATDHEYGRNLRARFVPLITGVGPIEAAIATSTRLQLLGQSRVPDLVVCLGSAGSRRCDVGGVYQIACVSWRDMDASRLGFPKGVTPFTDHPVAFPLLTPLWDTPAASLSTGANIVGGGEYDAIDADLVDMETFAVLRACQRFGIPMIGLRGVSDGPGELNGLTGWTDLLALLDERLAEAVDRIPEALGRMFAIPQFDIGGS
jgi:adenosylhomocysteine nucleosidase